MDKTKKRRIQILAASVFWLGVWQTAAAAIGQEVFLVSPVQAIGTLVELLPQAEFWQRIGFSAGRGHREYIPNRYPDDMNGSGCCARFREHTPELSFWRS